MPRVQNVTGTDIVFAWGASYRIPARSVKEIPLSIVPKLTRRYEGKVKVLADEEPPESVELEISDVVEEQPMEPEEPIGQVPPLSISGLTIKDATPIIAEQTDKDLLAKWLGEDDRTGIKALVEARLIELEGK